MGNRILDLLVHTSEKVVHHVVLKDVLNKGDNRDLIIQHTHYY